MKIDLFGGTGFIGSNFNKLYEECTHVHNREDNVPIHENVLYMISTTHNYHIFDDITRNTLEAYKPPHYNIVWYRDDPQLHRLFYI